MVRSLVLLGLFLVPLQAAATVQIVYTLALSYGLFAIAIVVGWRYVLRGVRLLPPWCAVAGASLLVIYLAMTLFGAQASFPGIARAGAARAFVYSAYLAEGIALIALFVGISDKRFVTEAVVALVLGGSVEALYGIYSWAALHYHLPASDVNNAVNSDGVTYGHRYEGPGLFGWERIRGTFTEPIGLGGFLVIPLILSLFSVTRRGNRAWRAGALGGLLLSAVALVLTDSSISAAACGLGALAAALLLAFTSGLAKTSAALFTAFAAALAVVIVLVVNPTALASVTGRTPGALEVTLSDRTTAWHAAANVWATRPVTGYGPGQAPTRLAAILDVSLPPGSPKVLRSAQGIVMSSLVDTGILGLCAYLVLFASVFAAGVKAAMRKSRRMMVALVGSTLAALLVNAVNGDRVAVQVWVMLGLILAATAAYGSERNSAEGDDESNARTY